MWWPGRLAASDARGGWKLLEASDACGGRMRLEASDECGGRGRLYYASFALPTVGHQSVLGSSYCKLRFFQFIH